MLMKRIKGNRVSFQHIQRFTTFLFTSTPFICEAKRTDYNVIDNNQSLRPYGDFSKRVALSLFTALA